MHIEQIIVNGIVQGIGFRPAVYASATKLKLKGCVYNDSRGVVIEVQGEQKTIDKFVEGLSMLDLNKMKIESLERTEIVDSDTPPLSPPKLGGEELEMLTDSESDFVILKTNDNQAASTLMPPDLAVCDECLQDLQNVRDKRHHGFHLTACTQCGPRFTVIRKMPYQWKDTANAPYPMCGNCRAEYEKPTTRRFNFETNICAQCGPQLKLVKLQNEKLKNKNAKYKLHSIEDPVGNAIKLLAQGKIIAIKGIGGYHIACDACSEETVRLLRERKKRPHKPFAVMFPDVSVLQKYTNVTNAEIELLKSLESPIVLVESRKNTPPQSPPNLGGEELDFTPKPFPRRRGELLAEGVAPGQYTIGAMLPYTPLHYLLVDRPLVMTSANVSGQPMMYRDEDVFEHLAGVVDYVLYHEREIVVNVDDSIARTVASSQLPDASDFVQIFRRSRGYVPEAIELPRKLEKKVLCLGAQQKNTFCLGYDNKAILSQHNGDLDTLESQEALENSLKHLMRVFDFRPDMIVCDMHPEYASTKLAFRMAQNLGLPLIQVQHHEAHVLGCLLEPRSDSPLIKGAGDNIIGVSFDGTGYGRDGSIWGGEFFNISKLKRQNLKDKTEKPAAADSIEIDRVAHLEYVDMPGGDYAVTEPYRMMLSYLWKAFGDRRIDDLFRDEVDNQTFAGVWELVKKGQSHVQTSSMGRLFDAVSALVTGRYITSYEGQAAMELETLAWQGNPKAKALPFALEREGATMVIRVHEMFKIILKQLAQGKAREDIAMSFHKTVADLVVAVIERTTKSTKKKIKPDVLLSGGVFQSKLLSQLICTAIVTKGFSVYQHRQVPMNDGGIAFGQLVYVLMRGVDRK